MSDAGPPVVAIVMGSDSDLPVMQELPVQLEFSCPSCLQMGQAAQELQLFSVPAPVSAALLLPVDGQELQQGRAAEVRQLPVQVLALLPLQQVAAVVLFRQQAHPDVLVRAL